MILPKDIHSEVPIKNFPAHKNEKYIHFKICQNLSRKTIVSCKQFKSSSFCSATTQDC